MHLRSRHRSPLQMRRHQPVLTGLLPCSTPPTRPPHGNDLRLWNANQRASVAYDSLFKHNAQTHRGGGRQAPAGTSSSPLLPPPNTACHSLYTPATWDFPFLQGHQPFSTSSCTQAGTLTSTPSPTLFSRPAHPALSAQISPRRSLHVPVFKTSSPPYSAALSSLYGAHLVCFSLAHPLASPIDTWTYASEGKP